MLVTALVAQTSRLRLRRLTVDDAPFILELLNEPAWLQYIGDKNVHSLADAAAYISNGPLEMYRRLGFGLFLVELAESKVSIGLCGLIKRDGLDDVDIGFALLEAFRSGGYAQEAATAVLELAADFFGLTRVVAITTLDNSASQRLLSRLGFTFERQMVLPSSTTELNLYARTLPRSDIKRLNAGRNTAT